MASATKLEMVNRQLRSVLLSEKAGVLVNRLQGEYSGLTGELLPFKQFGFSSLEAYLRSIPNVASLQRGPGGDLLCVGVADDTTKHIASLVSRQKNKKTNRIGMRSKPGRSYNHPTYFPRSKPVYSSYSKAKQVKPKFQPSRFFNWNGPSQNRKFKHSKLAFQPAGLEYQPAGLEYQPFGLEYQPAKLDYKPAKPDYKPAKPDYKPAKPDYKPAKPVKPTDEEIIATYHTPKPSEQFKPLASTYAAKPKSDAIKPKSDAIKPKQQSTNSQTTIKPGPWSGKLSSRRSTNELNREPAKPVYDNLYITVDNNSSYSEPKGKSKSGAKGKKQDRSTTFEIPPRFKKLMSPSGISQQDSVREVSHDVSGFSSLSPTSSASSGSSFSSGQPSPLMANGAPQIDNTTSDWVQQTLREKPSGVWSNALGDMHQKEFGRAMDESIIEQMSKLGLIQRESTLNCDILYPKLTVHVKDSPRSHSAKRSVNFGAGDCPHVSSDESRSQADDCSIDRSPSEDPPADPSEGRCSPTIEGPNVPSLQLPEDSEWIVYVAYIKSLSDFFVLVIGEDFSEQLIVLEEAMRVFYLCSPWSLTEAPEVGECYAAEFNREWLRVQVTEVDGDKVHCFLLDHGDAETTNVNSLRPLAEHFLQLPFQVIHCTLRHSEQVADDDSTALKMFCQLALGKRLLAEVASREGDRIEMDLFDDSDVSIFEQCTTAGI